MKKITAKDKNNKVKKIGEVVDPIVDPIVGLEEESPDEVHEAPELDPDILKVLVKPKKTKNIVDTTDYVPELERGDLEDGGSPEPGSY